jgi:hypothetical protein
MWHDCDSKCDSASRARRKVPQNLKKTRICVTCRELSTDRIAFFSATVAAMQQYWRVDTGESFANSAKW